MNWKEEVIEGLATAAQLPTAARLPKAWNYHEDGPSYTEPAALTALALIGADRSDAAIPIATWLAELQQPDAPSGLISQST